MSYFNFRLFYFFAFSMIILQPVMALACSAKFPAPIPMSQAFSHADAVFLGKITAITDGFPKDFKPEYEKEFRERKANLARQNIPSIGRTITFEPMTVWKETSTSNPQKTITLVEPSSQNSCEWNRNIFVGDEMLVFAAHYGNYLTFPALGFDGRSTFTLRNPFTRNYSVDHLEQRYAEQIKQEKATFTRTLKELNQRQKPIAPAAR
jgi:hypothetical protein